MSVKIPENLREILLDVLTKHGYKIENILMSDGTLSLTTTQAFDLRQALTDEFCETGLDDNDVPNDRGYDIESLIDLLGHAIDKL